MDIVKKFLKEYGVVRQQINSFDNCVLYKIEDIVESVGPLYVSGVNNVVIKLKNVRYTVPSKTESNGQVHHLNAEECRLRNFTYASNIYVDFIIKDKNSDNEKIVKEVNIGSIPVMIGSTLCNGNENDCVYDPGGYFVISGSEKVIIAQEKMANNEFFIFEKKKNSKSIVEGEIRCLAEEIVKSTTTIKFNIILGQNYKEYVRISLPYMKNEINIFSIYKYFGVDYPEWLIEKYPVLKNNIVECDEIEDIKDYFIKNSLYKENEEYIDIQMKNNFLHHTDKPLELLSIIIEKMCIMRYNDKPEDDRDHLKNKRVDMVGCLIATLFRQLYKKMLKDIQVSLSKNVVELSIIPTLVKTKIITNGLKYAFATGNWGINSSFRTGISQVLNRHSYMSTLSHLRRINSPVGKEGKMVKPRQLHGSHAFRICPCETPEGHACGLVKNMALTNLITLDSNSEPVKFIVKDFLKDDGDIYIYVNGDYLGNVRSGENIDKKLRDIRRNLDINPEIGITKNEKEIRIYTEGGRSIRPLVVLKDGVYPEVSEEESWMDLLKTGKIEYIDSSEEECLLIAMTPDDILERGLSFTHCEIHPCVMLGITSSNIPFPEHNQAPRVVYQCVYENEDVLMGDLTTKKIKDVRVGDEVISFNPETMMQEKTKVINQYVRDTDKNIVRVKTESGREIITTDDHKFMTNKGWVCPKDMTDDILVGTKIITERDNIVSYEYLKYKKNGGLLNIDEWSETIEIKEDIIFQKVSIEYHKNVRIADISVESNHQSFIGGDGFTIHNSAMGKQAMGMFSTKHAERMDTYSHVLHYPQRPLVNTQVADMLHYNELPSGMNVVVAIMCYSGYNQEDSIIMSQSAIDRGLFRSSFYRTYKEEQNVSSTSKETIEVPNKNECVAMKYCDYSKLDEDGIVKNGIKVESDDIIVGKTLETTSMGKKRDSSLSIRHNENGYIDRVMLSTNEQGLPIIKTKVRSLRIPEIGDKFASKHAQKGTIGITYTQEDMPFTSDGIIPDIIVNPHAIPSRMTVGQLIECIYGKYCAMSGTYGDATVFSNPDPHVISDALESIGYQRHGEETMYHGQTGEMLKAKIFIGPTYYQRLKHMVGDKIHARSRGPLQILTRQPVEGRARDGGLRFGKPFRRKVCRQLHASLRCGRRHSQIAGNSRKIRI